MHMVWRRIDRWGGSSVEGEDRGCRHMSASSPDQPGFEAGPSYLQAESELRFFLDIPRNSRNIGEFPLTTVKVALHCLAFVWIDNVATDLLLHFMSLLLKQMTARMLKRG